MKRQLQFRNHSLLYIVAMSVQQSSTLSDVYFSIANRATGLASWPQADDFRQCLDIDPLTQHYIAPTFGPQGPTAIFCLLERDPVAFQVGLTCQACFDQFCSKVRQTCSSDAQIEELNCFILPSKRLHLTMAVLQEHPRLLGRADTGFEAIGDDTLQRLATALMELKQCQSAVLLRLDRLLLTSDGAMIAGFVDQSKSGRDDYDAVKSGFLTQASRILGDQMSSRPKNLIHVTVGRIVGLPNSMTNVQREAIANLVRLFNNDVLPAAVQELRSSRRDSFALRHLSFNRNTIWLAEEFIEYAEWELPERNE